MYSSWLSLSMSTISPRANMHCPSHAPDLHQPLFLLLTVKVCNTTTHTHTLLPQYLPGPVCCFITEAISHPGKAPRALAQALQPQHGVITAQGHWEGMSYQRQSQTKLQLSANNSVIIQNQRYAAQHRKAREICIFRNSHIPP